MAELQKCSRCGAELPPNAPGHHCLQCLLQLGLATDQETEPTAGPSGTIQIAPSPSTPTEKPGDQIGHYKLLQQIGEGGCGVVYMAEQEEPVCRRVALKVIKLGMDTKNVIARFEAERQALAMMDHPNIARVLDAGATETGRPYFVMELVRGFKITDYCDQNNLSTEERLDLFIQICRAIQHAHQKGIIHRDIKPSNILVTMSDGVPLPKVIDFGIAKATHGKLTDQTLFTAFEQFIGTPAYMSPEQAEMSATDIDTRSDIYSLGVLLYELLTGKTPFDAKELIQAGLDEIRRTIREKEPARPSTRLSTMQDADLTVIARHRKAEPLKLVHLVRGDLDWIVMKALEKDRTRRYETANGFATDILRHLNNEPVLACPPGNLYRFQKLVRRNKLAFVAASAVTVALIMGLAFSTWLFLKERDARARAVKAERKAKTKADDAQAVLRFLQDKVLAAARPEGQQGGLGREVTLRRAVEAAEPQIALLFTNRPLVEAEIRNALGSTFFYLGDYSNAIQQAERCLALATANMDPEAVERLKYVNNLALDYRGAGRLPEAVPLYEQILKLRKVRLGQEHRDTLASMDNLGAAYGEVGRLPEAITLLEEALRLSRANLGAGDQQTIRCAQDLARAYRRAGRSKDALPLLEEAFSRAIVQFGRENPETLPYMNDVAGSYWAARRLPEAIAMFEEVLKLAKTKLGPENDKTLAALSNLASAYKDAGRLMEAIPLYEEALTASKSRLGPDHPYTLMFMNNLAGAYHKVGRLTEALPLWEETLRLQKAKLGIDHPETLATMNNLAVAYKNADRLVESLALSEEALKLSRAKLGPDHPTTLACMNTLASTCKVSARLSEALSIYEEMLKLTKAKLGPGDPQTLGAMYNLALTYEAAGRLSEALPLFEQNLELSQTKLGPNHPDTLNSMGSLATAYLETNRLAEAEVLLVKLLDAQRARPATENSPVAETLALLGECLLRQDKQADAEPLLRECLLMLEEKQPGNSITFNAQSLLGWTLLGQKQYANAESLLIKGYEGLNRLEGKGHSASSRRLLNEAGERIVQLYEDWAKATSDSGRAANAAEWKQRLKALGQPAPEIKSAIETEKK